MFLVEEKELKNEINKLTYRINKKIIDIEATIKELGKNKSLEEQGLKIENIIEKNIENNLHNFKDRLKEINDKINEVKLEIKEELRKILKERGLKFSEEKIKIVNITEVFGFRFKNVKIIKLKMSKFY